MAQVASVLMMKITKSASRIGYFVSADAVKFRKPVFPGDTLFIHAELTRARSNRVAKAKCQCTVNDAGRFRRRVDVHVPRQMSDVQIHPTAIVDAGAEIGAGCVIGPYCIVEAGVVLGPECWLQHHVTLCGPMRPARAISSTPTARSDSRPRFEICRRADVSRNRQRQLIREFVTVNRSTTAEGKTRVGSCGNFLAYSHIGHDCTVGDSVIFSNNGTLAGHVQIADNAIMGGLTAVHQFCRIGRFAITGGCSKIVQDVPPFMIADGILRKSAASIWSAWSETASRRRA
jgi:UDP-N-acetylglucosamine acyltransferase